MERKGGREGEEEEAVSVGERQGGKEPTERIDGGEEGDGESKR